MNLDSLINAAKNEQWEEIDSALPNVCNKENYKQWAANTGLLDADGNVRDLAVSMLEKTRILNPEIKERLMQLMRTDKNKFVRYRSAFAIAAHDKKYHPQEVEEVLKEAKQEKDVAEIAGRYLKEL
jgi:hypothetical protein